MKFKDVVLFIFLVIIIMLLANKEIPIISDWLTPTETVETTVSDTNSTTVTTTTELSTTVVTTTAEPVVTTTEATTNP